MAQQQFALFSGDLLFNRLVSAAYQGFQDLSAGSLAIKHNTDDNDIISKGRDTYGQLIGSIPVIKSPDLTLKFSNIAPRALSMALQGTASTFTQASGTATDEVFTAIKGGFANLAYRNISATGLSIKNSAGSTTYVKDTDYVIDYVTGQVSISQTSAITDGASLKITYSYNAVTADKIEGVTSPNVRGVLMLKGKNQDGGLPMELTAWDVVLTSESNIDWLSSKPIEISMKGKMITPTGKTSPYEVIYNQVLA